MVDLKNIPFRLVGYTVGDVEAVVAECPKQRFLLSEGSDGGLLVRANQGHSVPSVEVSPQPPVKCFTLLQLFLTAPLLYLAIGTPPWKIHVVPEIPYLIGFPIPPWISSTTQNSHGLLACALGNPIPHWISITSLEFQY